MSLRTGTIGRRGRVTASVWSDHGWQSAKRLLYGAKVLFCSLFLGLPPFDQVQLSGFARVTLVPAPRVMRFRVDLR